jgi:predicted dehydrogenase
MEDPTYPMFERELREFIASAKEGRTPSITVLDGLRVLEVVDAVLESAKLKRVVAI